MQQDNIIKQLPNQIFFLNSFFTKLKWAITAFMADRNSTMVKLQNGVFLDMKNKVLVIDDDFEIYTTGNLRLTSEKHIILNSGKTEEKMRPGYIHSVWINSNEDDHGNPLIDECLDLKKDI